MENTDIFYTILHDLQFFSHFFYKQYLLDLNSNLAFDIKDKSSQSLPMFFKQYPIKDYMDAKTTITYLDNNGILVKDTNYKNFYIVLYINSTLNFINTRVLSLESPALFNNPLILEDFLYKNTTQPMYIVFFNFYSSLDLSSQDTTIYIHSILKDTLENIYCYFQHVQYNCYYLLFKGLQEVEVFKQCLTLHHNFTTIKKPYLCPNFLITEYPIDSNFQEFIVKTKNHFLQLSYDEEIIIYKKAENL